MTTVSKHCIKAMTSLSGWYEGRDICRSHGADLARFHTKTELDYLQQNSRSDIFLTKSFSEIFEIKYQKNFPYNFETKCQIGTIKSFYNKINYTTERILFEGFKVWNFYFSVSKNLYWVDLGLSGYVLTCVPS